MGTCPVCSANVAEDFGLVECSKCGAQLIVGMDGSVEVAGAEETPPVEAIPQSNPQMIPPQQLVDDEFPLGPGMDADLPPPIEDAVVPAPPEPLPDDDEPASFDGNDPVADEAPPAVYKAPGSPADSPNLSDLAAFANSEDSGGREGPLRYTLLIHGIDTVDVRDAFREAITDRKLMWDIEQILRNIRQGFVKIENVPPGKAFIVINRLRNLPLQIRWEQHAITQP